MLLFRKKGIANKPAFCAAKNVRVNAGASEECLVLQQCRLENDLGRCNTRVPE